MKIKLEMIIFYILICEIISLPSKSKSCCQVLANSCLSSLRQSSSFAISLPFSEDSSTSVKKDMYVAALQIVSVLVGFFSWGSSGNKLRSASICEFRIWTRFRSLALATRRCLLIPVSLGPRRFIFFLPFFSSAAESSFSSSFNKRDSSSSWTLHIFNLFVKLFGGPVCSCCRQRGFL